MDSGWGGEFSRVLGKNEGKKGGTYTSLRCSGFDKAPTSQDETKSGILGKLIYRLSKATAANSFDKPVQLWKWVLVSALSSAIWCPRSQRKTNVRPGRYKQCRLIEHVMDPTRTERRPLQMPTYK